MDGGYWRLHVLRPELWRYVGTPPYGRLRWPRDRREGLGPLRSLSGIEWKGGGGPCSRMSDVEPNRDHGAGSRGDPVLVGPRWHHTRSRSLSEPWREYPRGLPVSTRLPWSLPEPWDSRADLIHAGRPSPS